MAKACILVALLAVAYTATVSSALYATTANGIGTWTDLFPPSHNSGVGYMNGLSCNTDTSCYVYSNSSGLYSFPGVPNGTLTPLTMPDPRVHVITAIVVSGPVGAPGGAVAVQGSKPVYYPVNKMTFMPSNRPPGFQVGSMDARTSTNGQEVLVMNSKSPSVLYSSNGGKDFNLKIINVTHAYRFATSRYGHMVDKNTWYVTMGFIMDDIEFFTQIVKTTDGGNTWTTQFQSSQSSGLLFFNAVECLSATHCVAVGEGFGVYIYRTVDGQTWKRVSITPPDHPYPYSSKLRVIRANAHGHLFAAGSQEIERTKEISYMLTSVDGGATWVEEPNIPNVVAISGLSFTPGGYGFATAICDTYRYSTILRYDPAPSQLLH